VAARSLAALVLSLLLAWPAALGEAEQDLPGVPTYFTLQIGAFATVEAARDAAAAARERGFEAYVVRGTSGDRQVMRVRSGAFETREAAERYKEMIGEGEIAIETAPTSAAGIVGAIRLPDPTWRLRNLRWGADVVVVVSQEPEGSLHVAIVWTGGELLALDAADISFEGGYLRARGGGDWMRVQERAWAGAEPPAAVAGPDDPATWNPAPPWTIPEPGSFGALTPVGRVVPLGRGRLRASRGHLAVVEDERGTRWVYWIRPAG
jgi:hypothetical protein